LKIPRGEITRAGETSDRKKIKNLKPRDARGGGVGTVWGVLEKGNCALLLAVKSEPCKKTPQGAKKKGKKRREAKWQSSDLYRKKVRPILVVGLRRGKINKFERKATKFPRVHSIRKKRATEREGSQRFRKG